MKKFNKLSLTYRENSAFFLIHCCLVANSLWPHWLQHARLPCSSLCPGVCPNSCLLIQWCYLTISSSATLFSFCLHSFPASGSFPVSWLYASGGQSIGASASVLVLLMNIQGWFPLGLTGLIFLQSKGLSRVLSSTTVWKHLVKITWAGFVCLYFFLWEGLFKKWKDVSYSQIGRFNILQMSILLKLIYRFNTILMKIQ